MSEIEAFEGKLGLADFLSDLRAELAVAAARAQDDPLKLHVEDVTVSLDVGVTIERKVGASVTAKAKFWVFASLEGKASGERSDNRMTTQHLTLTLKPRIETVLAGPDGHDVTVTRDVDVADGFARNEQHPRIPPPPTN